MIILHVFGFRRHGNPFAGKMPVVNCTVIQNPHRKNLSDAEAKARARATPGYPALVQEALRHLATHQEIAIGCMFGRHRSMAVAEDVALDLACRGDYNVEIRPYDGAAKA